MIMQGIFDGLIDVDLAKIKLGLPGKIPQVVDDFGDAIMALLNQLQPPLVFILFGQFLPDDVRKVSAAISGLFSSWATPATNSPRARIFPA